VHAEGGALTFEAEIGEIPGLPRIWTCTQSLQKSWVGIGEREREGWVLNLGKENACEKVMKKNKIKIKDVE
jgi:hypothetical protein